MILDVIFLYTGNIILKYLNHFGVICNVHNCIAADGQKIWIHRAIPKEYHHKKENKFFTLFKLLTKSFQYLVKIL